VSNASRCAACWGTDTYARGGLACPDQVDGQQLELAIELLSDVGKYAGNTILADYMRRGQPLCDLVKTVLSRNYFRNPRRSRGDASSQWT
jgi:hypothetical protein